MPARVLFDPDGARLARPEPKDVVVIAMGSQYIRYGRASDSHPRRVRTVAAFPRKQSAHLGSGAEPPEVPAEPIDRELFEKSVQQVADELHLNDRRRGGGKPVPWHVEVEKVDVEDAPEYDFGVLRDALSARSTIVGDTTDLIGLAHSAEIRHGFDIVHPIRDGRLARGLSHSIGVVRAALEAVLDHIGLDLGISVRADRSCAAPPGGEGEAVVQTAAASSDPIHAMTHVALIVPDSANRRDVAEFVDALFRASHLQVAAVFVHHNAASCALAAGLSTCVVVDIGHTSTTVCCIEEGCAVGAGRVCLPYGARHIARAFHQLFDATDVFGRLSEDNTMGTADHELLRSDMVAVKARAFEAMAKFSTDENDVLSIAMVRAPRIGRMLRVKCGVGIAAVPALGLVYPSILHALNRSDREASVALSKATSRDAEDDSTLDGLFDDVKRSAMVSTAVPFGTFASEVHALEPPDEELGLKDNALCPLPDAILWCVTRSVGASVATQSDTFRGSELTRRYLNAVVLAGGASAMDGIANELEKRLKRILEERNIVVNDVTIIDGARGRGDEELLEAAALLKGEGDVAGLDDDGDPASLPWRGAAVMVEADAVKDFYVYRDDWKARGSRSLRERVPFYW